ncbi:MAG: transporter substrate-binding domain-containing protein [Candidatus Cloacimonadales bacterium]
MKITKHLIIILILLSVSNLFSTEDEQPNLNQKLKIVIGAEPNYPPYSMVNKSGEPIGFSIDLFREATQAVNIEVEIKIGVWDKIKQDLTDGKLDALPLVGRTPEREKDFDFTLPYLSLHGAVFVRNDYIGISSREDLRGKKIAVMRGDNAEEYARRNQLSDQIFATNTYEEAFRQLSNGYYDAVIIQRLVGLELLKQTGIGNVKPLDFMLADFRQNFCFAVKDGDKYLLSLLNEGLSIVIANGTFDELHQKWFGSEPEVGLDLLSVMRVVAIIFIPLFIIIVVLWIFSLRRQVSNRTKHLDAEITQHLHTLQELEKNQQETAAKEDEIRLLLNSTAEGIYSVDTQGDCLTINNSALHFLGYADKAEVLGKNMHQLIHHSQPDGTKIPQNRCKIFQAFLHGEGTHSEEEVFWRKDGSAFPVEYFSYPIRKNNEITGSVITFWDISDRKKSELEINKLTKSLEQTVSERTAELQKKILSLDRSQKAMLYMVEDLNSMTQELKQERQKLKASNAELEAFTYSVSHDLRAPLRAIDGFSKFLVEDYQDKLDAEAKRYIKIIRDASQKMDKLIIDLLELSRISRGKLNLQKIDQEKLIKETYQDIASPTELHEFKLIIQPLPAIYCDLTLLKQVWQNLLSNALKYSSKSKIKQIEIGARVLEDEIIFYVKDQGAGFDEEYKDKLFGVFQRLHTVEEYQGTGVGLAIVHKIIQRHAGKIWAESKEQGATFYFSLPQNQPLEKNKN